MGAIASQITSLTIVYSTVYSDADQREYQSSASLAFVRGIHRGSVNSPHKWPVTRSRLTPVWGPHLLGGPNLLGDTHRPEPGTVSQISPTFTDILMASFKKHNSDWLRLGNVLNNMYHIRKVVSRHKNAPCSLDTYATCVWKFDAARHAV